jgi:protein phosphatase
MRTYTLPEFCLVVLIGASGSGKSTFGRTHFQPFEVISSDYCRGLVSDDETDQTATKAAFEVLHFIAAQRLKARRLTVIDATNVRAEDRKSLIQLAREYYATPIAIVINPGASVCYERNKIRPDRNFGHHVIADQYRSLKQNIRTLDREGFKSVIELRSVAAINEVNLERVPLWVDKRFETGPFDIVGDIHGCFDELQLLLQKLGYQTGVDEQGEYARPPLGRKLVLVGDLVDRGLKSPEVLRLVMRMVREETALCVLGNHEAKLLKYLDGKAVKLSHGLAETVAQLSTQTDDFKQQVRHFVKNLISHYVLDGGRLVVAHAGIKENMINRASGWIKSFCMYGETTGETDEFGLPVRYPWALDYRGATKVVYGHTPSPEAEWVNNTICLDTGCVFGGQLTALRYPELTLESVSALQTYCEPVRPLHVAESTLSTQQQLDDMLDYEDVSGKRIINTTLRAAITVTGEHAAAALEVMTRFAVDPHWLIYLPPTMSPSETSLFESYLEYPTEALKYFADEGITEVVCEEKHMGSRAVIVICRSSAVAHQRFGVVGTELGVIYTRTGRHFFNYKALSTQVLERLNKALEQSGLWEALQTDWMCLDTELLPWSAKAKALIQEQYAPVGAAARIGMSALNQVLQQGTARGLDLTAVSQHFTERFERVANYSQAWGHYCWDVKGLDDLQIAPFHLLASEGAVHMDKSHVWHMQTLAKLAATGDKLFKATSYQVLDPSNAEQVAVITQWWLDLTASGGEGIVIKPNCFIPPKHSVQPVLKCRGREYLRIIYGLEYDLPNNIARLRQRGLKRKRTLALREFALGHESLTRFVARQPLRRVHECVFALLAMESEAVDPRL